METTVRSGSLTGYVEVTRQLGLNPGNFLREVGLDASALADPQTRISAAAACRLLELTAASASCQTLGLQIAETRQKFGFGVIAILLAHKRTLREVLLATVQYRHLLNEALGIYVETAGDTVTIREEIVTEASIAKRQATELAVGIMARHCSAVLGAHWKPRSVHFIHSGPVELHVHRRFFGCPPVFNSDFNGIVCDAADLDRPNPLADPELVRYAESLAAPLNVSGPDAIVMDVRRAIYLLLPLEQASIETIADHLRLGVRTLQRNLDAAGTSFSTLVDEVRHELALRYMANPRYSIGRVGALLGYTRQSSFTHWFTQRFGMTPRLWRAAAAKAPA